MRLFFDTVDPGARRRAGRTTVALLASILGANYGCNSLDGIESPQPGMNGPDTGSSVCGVALPCPDEPGTETCVGAGAAVTCLPAGTCDGSDHLDLPCTGSAGCSGGVCCAPLGGQSLAGGQDCFASLPAAPGSPSCRSQPCPSGAVQLCSSDVQCGSAGATGERCTILVIKGAFEVSIGYCTGPVG